MMVAQLNVPLPGFVGWPDGSKMVAGAVRGPVAWAHALGKKLADELLSLGGHEILRDFGRTGLIPNS